MKITKGDIEIDLSADEASKLDEQTFEKLKELFISNKTPERAAKEPQPVSQPVAQKERPKTLSDNDYQKMIDEAVWRFEKGASLSRAIIDAGFGLSLKKMNSNRLKDLRTAILNKNPKGLDGHKPFTRTTKPYHQQFGKTPIRRLKDEHEKTNDLSGEIKMRLQRTSDLIRKESFRNVNPEKTMFVPSAPKLVSEFPELAEVNSGFEQILKDITKYLIANGGKITFPMDGKAIGIENGWHWKTFVEDFLAKSKQIADFFGAPNHFGLELDQGKYHTIVYVKQSKGGF